MDVNEFLSLVEKSGFEGKVTSDDMELPFSQIAMDSLDLYNVVTEIEEFAQVTITDEQLADVTCMGDILRLVN